MHEREHVLRAPQVTQSMHPAIDQLDVLGKPVDDQVARRTRQQRLPTARDRAQPRAPRQRQPEVVALIAQLRIGRVQTRSAPADRSPSGHTIARSSQLGLQRRRDRVRRARERAHHAVALSLLDRTHPVMLARSPDRGSSTLSATALAHRLAGTPTTTASIPRYRSAETSPCPPAGGTASASSIPEPTGGSPHISGCPGPCHAPNVPSRRARHTSARWHIRTSDAPRPRAHPLTHAIATTTASARQDTSPRRQQHPTFGSANRSAPRQTSMIQTANNTKAPVTLASLGAPKWAGPSVHLSAPALSPAGLCWLGCCFGSPSAEIRKVRGPSTCGSRSLSRRCGGRHLDSRPGYLPRPTGICRSWCSL